MYKRQGYNYEVVDKVVVVTRAKAVPVVPTVEVVKGQVKDASGKPLPLSLIHISMCIRDR